jgi:hypothetical protein
MYKKIFMEIPKYKGNQRLFSSVLLKKGIKKVPFVSSGSLHEPKQLQRDTELAA